MTGIERLRDIVDDGPYSGGMIHISVQKLREICEQIEREVDDISGRGSDVLAWVEEHGGLDAVRTSCGHADNRRVELCAALGIDTDTGWSDAMAEMVKRLMPEGMEWLLEVWPKWSNGEYCKFGDWWVSDKYGEPKPNQFRKLSIYTPEQLDEWGQGDGESYGYEWDFVRPADPKYRPDKVEPPVPKALDADGVEIRVGDTVWHKESGMKFTVEVLPSERGYQSVHLTDYAGAGFRFDPNLLTHRAPVLAADGVPLEVGQTVYHIADGKGYTVEKLSKYGAMVTPDGITGGCYMAEYLTHQRPDSWERLEEDADRTASLFDAFDADASADIRDLVRRAKALAGVSE